MPRTMAGRSETGRTTCHARNWCRSTGEKRGTDRGGRWSRKPRVTRFIQRRPLRIAHTRRSTDCQNPPPLTRSMKRLASCSGERSRLPRDIRISMASGRVRSMRRACETNARANTLPVFGRGGWRQSPRKAKPGTRPGRRLVGQGHGVRQYRDVGCQPHMT